MLLSTRDLFKRCYGRYGIAAVNVEFMEQVHGLFSAAQYAHAPFIVQTTPAARDYAGADMLISMIKSAARIYPRTVFAIHLDHGCESHIGDALSSGAYTSVMIDASHDPLQRNMERTRAVVELAHRHEVAVEAELGVLSGVEDNISVDERMAAYTDPDQVEAFVGFTKCDSLAVAVGTSHGAYKFAGGQDLQVGILQDIQRRLPGYPLVLHGASRVDPDEVDRINKAGGKLDPTAKGVDLEQLQRSIQLGVCKVNIATDARLLWTRVVREFMRDHPEQFAPIESGKKYIEEYRQWMIKKFDTLRAIGKAAEFL